MKIRTGFVSNSSSSSFVLHSAIINSDNVEDVRKIIDDDKAKHKYCDYDISLMKISEIQDNMLKRLCDGDHLYDVEPLVINVVRNNIVIRNNSYCFDDNVGIFVLLEDPTLNDNDYLLLISSYGNTTVFERGDYSYNEVKLEEPFFNNDVINIIKKIKNSNITKLNDTQCFAEHC